MSDSTLTTIKINGRTYEERTFRALVDGDIVLASYYGGHRGRLGTGTTGGFKFRFWADDLADSQTR